MKLSEVKGIGATSAELIEAAGILTAEDLCDFEVGELVEELTRANDKLKIRKSPPKESKVKKWLVTACDLTGKELQVSKGNGADSPGEVALALPQYDPGEIDYASLPEARPVNSKVLVAAKVKPADVPEGYLISLDSSPAIAIPAPKKSQAQRARRPTSLLSPKPEGKKILNTRQPASEEENSSPAEVDQEGQKDDRHRLVRAHKRERSLASTTNEETNLGKDPSSRFYIRGVLHPRPKRLRFAALMTLSFLISIPVTIICAVLVVLDYSKLYLIAPVVSLVLLIFYLIYARTMKCRICSNPIFVSKSCRKHSRAHHVPILGYLLPTSLHILVFRWFRCIYCGTSIRLKE